MNNWLSKTKILVCVGTGGVGKTTVAASLGIAAAKKGLNVLVLTIDPAKRLAQALGLNSEKTGDVFVPDQNFKGKLFAGIIDPEASFSEFVKYNSSDKNKAETLLNNTLFKQLSTNLSGSQEFTSLDRLYRAVNSNKYDLVILDTPPAQNAMDFFKAPEKIYALFQKSITKWFAIGSSNQNLMSKIINKGTLTVLNALEKLTGAAFIGELAEFFVSIQDIQEVISQRSINVHKMLLDESTQFILVSAYDKIKLLESKNIYFQFQRFGYHLRAIIINRCPPDWGLVETKLKGLCDDFEGYYSSVKAEIEDFKKILKKRVKILKIYELDSDLSGVSELSVMADKVEKALKEGAGA